MTSGVCVCFNNANMHIVNANNLVYFTNLLMLQMDTKADKQGKKKKTVINI